MKTSPLQLDWVSYPRVAFETQESEPDSDAKPGQLVVEPTVAFELDGKHLAFLTVASPDGAHAFPYTFAIEVVAQFQIDVEAAVKNYRVPRERLAPVVAANIARVLFSGVREFLTHITARGPRDAMTLPSLMIEPSDVRIGSKEPAAVILEKVFGIQPEQLEKLRAEGKEASSGDPRESHSAKSER